MRTLFMGISAVLIVSAAYAQTGQTPSARPSTAPATTASPAVSAPTTAPGTTGLPTGQRGSATASGNGNQAVATTSANAPTPAKGANSFTMGQAQARLKDKGFADVGPLAKDQDGVWRGKATKSGQQVSVWVDYKGNVGQQ